jgi:hypothetical protein
LTFDWSPRNSLSLIQNLKSKIVSLGIGGEHELDFDAWLQGVVRFNGDRFGVFTGRRASINLHFDRARLTRREDFREVHSRAPSAGFDCGNVERSLTCVPYGDGSGDTLALRLFAEVYLRCRNNQLWRGSGWHKLPGGGNSGRSATVRFNLSSFRRRLGRLARWRGDGSGTRRHRSVLCDGRTRRGVAVGRLGLARASGHQRNERHWGDVHFP